MTWKEESNSIRKDIQKQPNHIDPFYYFLLKNTKQE